MIDSARVNVRIAGRADARTDRGAETRDYFTDACLLSVSPFSFSSSSIRAVQLIKGLLQSELGEFIPRASIILTLIVVNRLKC